MLQTTVVSELSEPLPEIELRASDIRQVAQQVKTEILEHTGIISTIKTLLDQFADMVADRVLAKFGSVPSTPHTVIVPKVTADTKVEPPTVINELPAEPTTPAVKSGKRQLSEESRRKISESQRARWATRDRSLSPEAKKKISDSQKARWASRNGHATPREPDTSEADCPVQHNNSVAEPAVQPVPKEATLAVREGYRGDAFYISEDGHFIGDDGFVVPKDFTEFIDRYPRYIESWARRRLNGQGIEEDVEDWTQELIIHMKYLPPTSKHRQLGKDDVIQTFDPFAQYGSSERRWRNYVNNCLANKYNTIFGKRAKNPVCRPGNVSLLSMGTRPGSTDNLGAGDGVTDEYVYSNSEYLTTATNREEAKLENSAFTRAFLEYVKLHDPDAYPVLEAFYMAGSSSDTIKEFCQTCQKLATTVELADNEHEGHTVGMTQKEFNRTRNRLKQLAAYFTKQKTPPKARRVEEEDEDEGDE